MTDPITAFAANHANARRRSFRVGEFTVMVEPHDDGDAQQEAFTRHLAALCGVVPRDRMTLLGPGYVREQNGKLWLLGKRETGFVAYGVPVVGWPELFATYAVRPGEHGRDEHGEYWQVVPEVSP